MTNDEIRKEHVRLYREYADLKLRWDLFESTHEPEEKVRTEAQFQRSLITDHFEHYIKMMKARTALNAFIIEYAFQE